MADEAFGGAGHSQSARLEPCELQPTCLPPGQRKRPRQLRVVKKWRGSPGMHPNAPPLGSKRCAAVPCSWHWQHRDPRRTRRTGQLLAGSGVGSHGTGGAAEPGRRALAV